MPFSVRLPPPVPFPSDISNVAQLVQISLEKLVAGDKQESIKVFEACKKSGFFLLDLRDAQLGEALMNDADAIMGLSDDLFALDEEEKQKFALKKGSFSGYKGVGKLRVDARGTPDRNEFFGVLKDELLGISPTLNQPDLIKHNKELYSSFTRRAEEVASIILAHLGANLHLPPGTLESLHRLSEPSANQARLIRYEPQPDSDRRISFVAHSDFGSITVLFNILGGLQILPQDPSAGFNGSSAADTDNSPDWQYVHPLPGYAIINIGDAMAKFTNGLLRSVLHRVTYAPGDQGNLVRNSLGYFVRPENAVLLKRLDGSDIIPPLDDGVAEEDISTEDWVDVKGSRERMDSK